jgi:hypothetical protein
MGTQVGWRGAAFVNARGLLKTAEELRHAARIEARLDQRLQADAVGLALRLARKIELLLDGRCLTAQDRGLRQIAR